MEILDFARRIAGSSGLPHLFAANAHGSTQGGSGFSPRLPALLSPPEAPPTLICSHHPGQETRWERVQPATTRATVAA